VQSSIYSIMPTAALMHVVAVEENLRILFTVSIRHFLKGLRKYNL